MEWNALGIECVRLHIERWSDTKENTGYRLLLVAGEATLCMGDTDYSLSSFGAVTIQRAYGNISAEAVRLRACAFCKDHVDRPVRIEGRGLEDVTGRTPDISEWLDLGFYDLAWYYKHPDTTAEGRKIA